MKSECCQRLDTGMLLTLTRQCQRKSRRGPPEIFQRRSVKSSIRNSRMGIEIQTEKDYSNNIIHLISQSMRLPSNVVLDFSSVIQECRKHYLHAGCYSKV